MSKQYNDPAGSQDSGSEQNQQNVDPAQQGNLAEQGLAGDKNSARYSHLGPHGNYQEEGAEQDDNLEAFGEQAATDDYGPQDQFGDVDGQDPYSNLNDDDPGSTPAGEDEDPDHLYGLAEPLAKEGDVSKQGSERDRYGTRISQDQQGYQQ